ncbi:hypothetical protein Taro_054629 [Colocasia esculenta]|uniref:Rab3GAP catalytic subunit conserved domain-containing protein n=1 Tax=Colocasia esculenta TaxID=4460 RepID=A0A843XQL5_COLES|nr:hypothetical protein [Colocasia esculenta]
MESSALLELQDTGARLRRERLHVDAANPGCILEDFVTWYSPPDWKEENLDSKDDTSLKKGCLSGRMQTEGNLWRELWETAKPLPAAKQAPLFDEGLAVENIFTSMVDMPPSELLEQPFLSLLKPLT